MADELSTQEEASCTHTQSALAHASVEYGEVLANQVLLEQTVDEPRESSEAMRGATPALGILTMQAPCCAQTVRPGQFVHLELPCFEAHLLRRPFSVYQADAEQGTISLMYQAVGVGTEHLYEVQAGAQTSIIGPVGRGWQVPADTHKSLLVGGGVGAAPLYLLAEALLASAQEVEVILGARTESLLACEEAFIRLLGTEQVHITTDDGSRGTKGFVTQEVEALIAQQSFDYLATCGPEPMQRAVSLLAEEQGLACEVSLERRMACGIGACLSCVVDTVQGKKRACVDGPVFSSREVVW